MKYYTYIEPNDAGEPVYHTFSEENIIDIYAPYFFRRGLEIGKDPRVYTLQDILDDWIVVNWAWETDANGVKNG